MKTNPLSTVYFRFLRLSRSLAQSDAQQLDANHRVLLETIVLAWYEGKPMTVCEAIALHELGSSATLHKRLATLRQEGYVENFSPDGDRRTKMLTPTEKSLHYFEMLAQALSESSLQGQADLPDSSKARVLVSGRAKSASWSGQTNGLSPAAGLG